MSKDTGGPAFPTMETEKYHPQDGMTLRDYFAAQALNGLVERIGRQEVKLTEETHQTVARHAYIIADAMLAERAKAGAA